MTVRFLFLVFAFCLPLQATAAATYVCNESREDIYVSFRHHARSIIVSDSRTEGWHRVPVRGFLRSCKAVTRRVNTYVVVAVKRDGYMVPVKVSLRWPDVRRDLSACVTETDRDFSYRSNGRDDASCPPGQVLAPVSVGAEGGTNDVFFNVSANFSSVVLPQWRKDRIAEQELAAEAEAKAAAERRKAEAEQRKKNREEELVRTLASYRERLSDTARTNLTAWEDRFKKDEFYLCEDDFIARDSLGYSLSDTGRLAIGRKDPIYNPLSSESWGAFFQMDLGISLGGTSMAIQPLPIAQDGTLDWRYFACFTKTGLLGRSRDCRMIGVGPEDEQGSRAVHLTGPYHLNQDDAAMRERGLPVSARAGENLSLNSDIFTCGRADAEDWRKRSKRSERIMVSIVAAIAFISVAAILFLLFLVVRKLVRIVRR